jgi:beta-carotene 3-hydroxylase
MRNVFVALAAFVLMEPFTYAAHRWVMHGVGERLHRSHHLNAARSQPKLIEANDLYPMAFAAVVMALLAVGFNAVGFSALIPMCIGITVYGAAYFTVHDIYIHRRIRLWGTRKPAALEHLAKAHRTHHATNGEPYGMLFPVLRQAKGSLPSQVPVES